MRDRLIAACRSLVEDRKYNDFWLLSLARDNSFEEGSRSRPQKRLIERYQKADVPGPMLELLSAGVNGSLAVLLETQASTLGRVVRNQWAGHDIIIGLPNMATHALVEIKVLHECIEPKHYGTVAADYLVKLRDSRLLFPSASLFLVAFFVECPSMNYPAGRWKNSSNPSKARREYLRNAGIDSQCGLVTRALGLGPTWPDKRGAFSVKLRDPSPGTCQSMKALYETQFDFAKPWSCDATQYFSAARVGVAIWEYPIG